MSYVKIKDFGPNVQPQDPMSLIASTGLMAGFHNTQGTSILNPQGTNAQKFASQYCAQVGWDGICEVLSENNNRSLPNVSQNCLQPGGSCSAINGLGNSLTVGQMLVRNTAAEKYLSKMSANCNAQYQPFDPTTPASPLFRSWVDKNNDAGVCIPIYAVNPAEIDNDPVMNKILAQPWIALDILLNIYNNAKRQGTLHHLDNTKLGSFFKSEMFRSIN